MTDHMEQRVEKLEDGFDKIVVILQGKPVYDISENHIIRYEGGMEAKLDGILEKLPRRWTVTQRISASMVIVIFVVGMAPVLAWAV